MSRPSAMSWLLTAAGLLLIAAGALLAYRAANDHARLAFGGAVALGLLALRQGLLSRNGLLSARFGPAVADAVSLQRSRRPPLSLWEVALYALSVALLGAIVVAGQFNYFNDILTYAFAGSFALSGAVYFWRRVL